MKEYGILGTKNGKDFLLPFNKQYIVSEKGMKSVRDEATNVRFGEAIVNEEERISVGNFTGYIVHKD